MKKIAKKFLSNFVAIMIAALLITPSMAITPNLPMGDIGDAGTWATENNLFSEESQRFFGNAYLKFEVF